MKEKTFPNQCQLFRIIIFACLLCFISYSWRLLAELCNYCIRLFCFATSKLVDGDGDGVVFHGDEHWLRSVSKWKRYTFQFLFHQCLFQSTILSRSSMCTKLSTTFSEFSQPMRHGTTTGPCWSTAAPTTWSSMKTSFQMCWWNQPIGWVGLVNEKGVKPNFPFAKSLLYSGSVSVQGGL